MSDNGKIANVLHRLETGKTGHLGRQSPPVYRIFPLSRISTPPQCEL